MTQQQIQFVPPEQRRVGAFMGEMPAEIDEEVLLAQQPCLNAGDRAAPASIPDRVHIDGVHEWWVGERPVRLHGDPPMPILYELERVGIGFRETRTPVHLDVAE